MGNLKIGKVTHPVVATTPNSGHFTLFWSRITTLNEWGLVQLT